MNVKGCIIYEIYDHVMSCHDLFVSLSVLTFVTKKYQYKQYSVKLCCSFFSLVSFLVSPFYCHSPTQPQLNSTRVGVVTALYRDFLGYHQGNTWSVHVSNKVPEVAKTSDRR